jgi:hypothetical protein
MPANLPVGRDLTIRRKIESGRYYCAFGRSKASNQGTTSRSTRALLAGHRSDLEGALFRPVKNNRTACLTGTSTRKRRLDGFRDGQRSWVRSVPVW